MLHQFVLLVTLLQSNTAQLNEPSVNPQLAEINRDQLYIDSNN